MVKKIVFAFLILPMIFSNISYAKEENEKQDSPGNAIFVMAIPNEIEIKEELIETTKKDVIINAKVPHIQGLTDKRIERKINKHLKMRIANLRKEIQNTKEQNDKSDQDLAYEVISNYKVKESMGNLLTIGLFDYIYTGGAHGLPYQSYMVIDTSENKILTLESLFSEEVNYKEQIENLIHKQMADRTIEGEVFYDDLSRALTINEDERFYIYPNGDLVIIFNVYEIAPYASGVIEFVLPKEQLKGYLLNQ